jgi:hypothetical protein
MIMVVIMVLAICIASSTREGRAEMDVKLAKYNWLFGGLAVVLWAILLSPLWYPST